MIRIGHALLLITLLSGTSASQAADIEDGLFAWYPFDDGAIDKTGNVEPVGTGRGLQIVAGKFGGAVHLDGKSYVTIPVDLNPDVIPDTTISMWVKTDPPPDDPALAKQLPNALFVLSESIGLSNLGNDSTYYYARSLNNSVVGPKHVVRRGQWQHVALVRWIEDRPGRDGNKIPHVVSQLHTGGRMTESAVPFKGQDMHVDLYLGTGSPRYEHMFRGAVDELRIYDRALSEEEIGLLAKAKVSAFPGDNFRLSDTAFPGDNFDPNDAAFPGDNFDQSDAAFPGDNFDQSNGAFPGDNFDHNEPAPIGENSTTDTSALDNVNYGEVGQVDRAADNPVDVISVNSNTTPPPGFPSGAPTRLPHSQTGNLGGGIDDPDLASMQGPADWRIVGMLPLTTAQKEAGIYPGTELTIRIRLKKDDVENKIPDVKLELDPLEGRSKSVISLTETTSETVPTAQRDVPITLTVPKDISFADNASVVSWRPIVTILNRNSLELFDSVRDNNERELSIQVSRPRTSSNCGDAAQSTTDDRTVSDCLSAPIEPSSTIYVDTSVLVFTETPIESGHENDLTELLVLERGDLLQQIEITEAGDKACKIEIGSRSGGWHMSSKCGSETTGNDRLGISISEIEAIVGIRICRNLGNNRVKGIGFYVRRVYPDGTFGASTQYRGATLPNCAPNNWTPPQYCQPGAAAAGLRLRLSDGTLLAPRKFFHSVDLACGEVKVREDT